MAAVAKLGLSAGTETHGGADIYKVKQLLCDFSVTTNALGPVPSAVRATGDLFQLQAFGDGAATCAAVEHYPNREDHEMAETVAKFLRPDEEKSVAHRLAFGNGASELIDLLGRCGPSGPGFCLMPKSDVQYREYERACKNAGRSLASSPQDAAIICVVNPTNPTGRFMEQAELEAWIEDNAKQGSWVVVDESMLFWAGADWHAKGVSEAFIARMLEKNIHVFIVHSWTKIFACTGLRVGSTLCPSEATKQKIEALQVPWSLTVFAKTYLKAAINDPNYLPQTWELTPVWRAHMIEKLQAIFRSWQFHGQPWLSWIWVDTGSVEAARAAYETSLACGCPLRTAASGYDRPAFIRLAVRRPTDFEPLYKALLATKVELEEAIAETSEEQH